MRTWNKEDQIAVSPVIAVILMVAITVVLSGVVFVWATSFANDAEGEPYYFHVEPKITTTPENHPDQVLIVSIISGTIKWNEYTVKINEIVLNTSTNEDKAGEIEIFDIPNGDYPTGGIDLQIGSVYHLKIISIDQNRIVFNDILICSNGE
jgi:flagellin-like protein